MTHFDQTILSEASASQGSFFYIATHSGQFHADELCAIAALSLLPPYNRAKIVRTRNPQIIDNAAVAIDVGFAYDPPRGRYDHHQAPAPMAEEGYPYSSFGLIWRHFGTDIIKTVGPTVTEEIAVVAARKIQLSFVRQVDEADNGVIEPSPTDLNRILGSFNVGIRSTEDRDFQFGQALQIARTILLNIIVQTIAAAVDEEKVKSAIAEQAPTMDRRFGILRLPAPMAWRTAVVAHNKSGRNGPRIAFVIAPNTDGADFGLTGVPADHGTLATVVQLPEELAGRTPEELAEAVDPDLTFVHRGRFFAAGRTLEVLEKLASLSIEGR